MKKKPTLNKAYPTTEPEIHMIGEANTSYEYVSVQDNSLNNYSAIELSYKEFKKILDTNVFTIAEWAALLQLSERTFHRYAKSNLSFNAILTERINLLNTLITEGLQLFGANFKNWLNSEPYSLFGQKPIEILFTQKGIVQVYKIMKRMQHGIVA